MLVNTSHTAAEKANRYRELAEQPDTLAEASRIVQSIIEAGDAEWGVLGGSESMAVIHSVSRPSYVLKEPITNMDEAIIMWWMYCRWGGVPPESMEEAAEKIIGELRKTNTTLKQWAREHAFITVTDGEKFPNVEAVDRGIGLRATDFPRTILCLGGSSKLGILLSELLGQKMGMGGATLSAFSKGRLIVSRLSPELLTKGEEDRVAVTWIEKKEMTWQDPETGEYKKGQRYAALIDKETGLVPTVKASLVTERVPGSLYYGPERIPGQFNGDGVAWERQPFQAGTRVVYYDCDLGHGYNKLHSTNYTKLKPLLSGQLCGCPFPVLLYDLRNQPDLQRSLREYKEYKESGRKDKKLLKKLNNKIRDQRELLIRGVRYRLLDAYKTAVKKNHTVVSYSTQPVFWDSEVTSQRETVGVRVAILRDTSSDRAPYESYVDKGQQVLFTLKGITHGAKTARELINNNICTFPCLVDKAVIEVELDQLSNLWVVIGSTRTMLKDDGPFYREMVKAISSALSKNPHLTEQEKEARKKQDRLVAPDREDLNKKATETRDWLCNPPRPLVVRDSGRTDWPLGEPPEDDPDSWDLLCFEQDKLRFDKDKSCHIYLACDAPNGFRPDPRDVSVTLSKGRAVVKSVVSAEKGHFSIEIEWGGLKSGEWVKDGEDEDGKDKYEEVPGDRGELDLTILLPDRSMKPRENRGKGSFATIPFKCSAHPRKHPGSGGPRQRMPPLGPSEPIDMRVKSIKKGAWKDQSPPYTPRTVGRLVNVTGQKETYQEARINIDNVLLQSLMRKGLYTKEQKQRLTDSYLKFISGMMHRVEYGPAGHQTKDGVEKRGRVYEDKVRTYEDEQQDYENHLMAWAYLSLRERIDRLGEAPTTLTVVPNPEEDAD